MIMTDKLGEISRSGDDEYSWRQAIDAWFSSMHDVVVSITAISQL